MKIFNYLTRILLVITFGISFIILPLNSEAKAASTLKELREENNYKYVINIDGGINADTISLAKESGVDMVVSGSYICKSSDFDERIKLLKEC